jgi:hypothetical protein
VEPARESPFVTQRVERSLPEERGERAPPGAAARALVAATFVLVGVALAMVLVETLRPAAIASGVLAPPPLRAEHLDLRLLRPEKIERPAHGEGPFRRVPHPPLSAVRPPPDLEPPAPAELPAIPPPRGSQERATAKSAAVLRGEPAAGAEEVGRLEVGLPVLVLQRKGGFALVLQTGKDGVNMGWADERSLGK